MRITACPDPALWAELLDGQVKEADAEGLRAHAQGCSRCRAELSETEAMLRRLAAPLPQAVSADAVSRVMQRVRSGEGKTPQSRSLPRRWVPIGAAVMALAAGTLLFVTLREREPDQTWAARGSGPSKGPALSKRVAISFHAVRAGSTARELASGAEVRMSDGLLVKYRSLVADKPAHLLAFGVDAKGDVHWLYPAHLSESSDEQSEPLSYSREDRAMRDGVVLASPSPGPLRLTFVVTADPLRVSQIEESAPAERSVEGLRRRWPEAYVDSVEVRLVPGR